MSHAKILYLGLRPKPGMYHYPVIRTKRCSSLEPALKLWPQFTHVIFTSQTAVEYWPGPWDKPMIAIGKKTAEMLEKKGACPLVASVETQEGIIELIKDLSGFFFIPRSNLARSDLTNFLEKEKIPFFAFDLYETELQKIEPVPNLRDFDEIIFTSPSTVKGFLQIYKSLPKNKKLTPIGPITKRALEENGR